MRDYTRKMIDAVNDGRLDPLEVVAMALNWLSEADVKEMCHANDLFLSGDNDPYGVPDEDEEA